MWIKYLGEICNFYNSIKLRSLFSPPQISSGGKKKASLSAIFNWNVINSQVSRPGERWIFIALAIVHIRNMIDQKIQGLSAFREALYCRIPSIFYEVTENMKHSVLFGSISALQMESASGFARPECPEPTQSGGSLGLSSTPLKVSMAQPVPS